MVKNPIIKETAWLSPEVQRLLGTGTLETTTRRHGLSISLKSDRLAEVVYHLTRVYRVGRIVETGTFDGSGTTMTYAKTGLPVHTCEAHRKRYEEARSRLASFRNVFLSHSFTTREADISPQYRSQLGAEHAPQEEGWLARVLDQSPPGEPILVSLDSGGDVGMREAEVLTAWIDACKEPRTVSLILDDIHYQKHMATVPLLETKYGVDIYQVDDRWGFTVIDAA